LFGVIIEFGFGITIAIEFEFRIAIEIYIKTFILKPHFYLKSIH